jgi:hypothetical protein
MSLSYQQGWGADPAFLDIHNWLIHQGGLADPCFPPKQP